MKNETHNWDFHLCESTLKCLTTFKRIFQIASLCIIFQIETALSEIEANLPEIETALSEIEANLPEIETALSEIEANLPEIETAQPQSQLPAGRSGFPAGRQNFCPDL